MSNNITQDFLVNNSNNNNNNNSDNHKKIYVYDISHTTRQQLCDHLEELNVWKQLAQEMGFTEDDIQSIINRQRLHSISPSVEILKIWGDQYNHTAAELFTLLHRLKLYQAMRIIKNYVNRQQQLRIPQSTPAFSEIMGNTPDNEYNIDRNKLPSSIISPVGISNSNNEEITENNFRSRSNINIRPQAQQTSVLINSNSIKEYASRILEINYDELAAATQNWHENCILGKGGFGIVYKGYWKHTEVAIKQIHYRGAQTRENIKIQIHQSLNELKYLNSCRHDNVLPLYGYSIRGERPCLVYQLMKGGSLEQRLNSKKLVPLTWQQRINICLGTARGINYLHTFRDKPLIHGDIKPANVLLDQCLQPKIGDFGLAREGPNAINLAVEVTQVFGTKPYLPPEFLHSKKLSTKVDTYSFGVVLLETFTGLRVYDIKREHPLLVKHITQLICSGNCTLDDLIDKRVPLTELAEEEICKRSVQLSLLCIADNASERPEMEQVLQTIDSYYNYSQLSS